MRYLPGNAQHIGARSSQQDSFGFGDPHDAAFIAHGGFLAIVCDGMGGMEHGDAASRTAVRGFLDAYQRKTPAESIPEALERAVREANARVVALARSMGRVEAIGTTLVAAALHERSLYYISVGDSGLFRVSGGQIESLNEPHIFARLLDQAVARGAMTHEEAMVHPERESLTSFIGAEVIEEIDRNVAPLPLRDGDTVLLASDGMFKTLSREEMRACLQGHPQAWPDSLVEVTIAQKREYQDNVTVLSVTVESEARAAIPRTVLMAPPPPEAAGVPRDSRGEGIPPAATAAAPVAAAPPPAADWTPPALTAPAARPRRAISIPWTAIAGAVLVILLAVAAWVYFRSAPGPQASDPQADPQPQAAPPAEAAPPLAPPGPNDPSPLPMPEIRSDPGKLDPPPAGQNPAPAGAVPLTRPPIDGSGKTKDDRK